MTYSILVANGSETIMCVVKEVVDISIEDNVYFLRNKLKEALFSAPVDSVIYISVN